jgi:hypothetical protein
MSPMFAGALQFPTSEQGFQFQFPAGEKKYQELFRFDIGRIEELSAFRFCFSTILELLGDIHAPQEVGEAVAFVTQLTGYIGGDLCIATPFTASDAGALQMQLMIEFQCFKDEIFGKCTRSMLVLPHTHIILASQWRQ